MEESTRELRESIQHHRSNKSVPGRNYPDSLRSAIVAHAAERQAAGDGVHTIAASLGLNPNTLYTWLRASATERRPPAAFRKVRISNVPPDRSSPTPGGPTLVTPEGFRVEGLDVAGLVAVLRSLA